MASNARHRAPPIEQGAGQQEQHDRGDPRLHCRDDLIGASARTLDFLRWHFNGR
jgi:hypothetical protein